MAFRRTFYGINLGTIYTVVAKVIKENNSWKYTKLKLPNMPVSDLDDVKETELLPSVVYFAKDGRVVVGEYAKQAIHYDPEHVYINTKINLVGSLGQNEYNESLSQRAYTEILKICFSKIIEDNGINAKILISVPTTFNQDERNNIINAANKAISELGFYGIKLVGITEELFAAFINLVANEKSFINMNKNEKNTIMLIDIGGSTMNIVISDIIYKKEEHILQVDTLYEPITLNEFSGVRFDYELMKKFMQDFLYYYELYEHELLEQDKIILEKRMLIIMEEAKKFLCDKTNLNKKYNWIFNFEGLKIDLNGKPPFTISISKKQMDILLNKLLNSREKYENNQSIRTVIQKALSCNRLTFNDIDYIYLIGGMANYDQVSNTIKSVVQKPIIIAEDPLYCKAIGTALSLIIQTPEGTREITKTLKKPFYLNNYNFIKKDISIDSYEFTRFKESYYIDIGNNSLIEIILKDETYPCNIKKSNVQFKVSFQNHMRLIFYKSYIYNCSMWLLRTKTVEISKMVNIGDIIDIWYEIDSNKVITIYAFVDDKLLFDFYIDED